MIKDHKNNIFKYYIGTDAIRVDMKWHDAWCADGGGFLAIIAV